MKTGVVVVNTARGAVIDEDALVRALDNGKVLSAGLDVFEEEPKIHPGLVRNPNVMLVPHMGTWTVEVSKQKTLDMRGSFTPLLSYSSHPKVPYHHMARACYIFFLLTSNSFS